MMAAGEEKIVAERIHAILSNPPKQDAPARTAAPAVDLTGQWDVQIEYAANTSNHTLHVKQAGNRIEGTHQGDFVSRDLAGTIDGNTVQISQFVYRAARRCLELPLQRAPPRRTSMSGTLDMGEYLTAKWSAQEARLSAGLAARTGSGFGHRDRARTRVQEPDRNPSAALQRWVSVMR